MAKAKKKKKFFDAEIPILKKTTQLIAYEPEELDKKTIRYDLTRFLRGKSAILKLKVKIKGNKLTSVPKEIKLLPYFLKRMVRKGTNYVEDSFSTKCKDEELKIKPFLITRKKVSRAVRKALREKAKSEFIKYVRDKPSELLFKELLQNKIQKTMSLKLKKIYPLSLCEIRILKVIEKKE